MAGVALVLSLAASGCYSYVLIPVDQLSVGQPVRARISGAQAERLEPVLGDNGRELDGKLLEKQDSGIVMAVSSAIGAESGVYTRAYQRIAIPRSELEEVEIRRLDHLKTGVAIAGGVVAVSAIFAAASGAIDLGTGQGKSNPNKARVPVGIPLFRLRIGR
ncbi:MAG TPA: hypothetical protein VJU87_13075 [Gemmatimonadaceae bacterium]|nr:hypothetical protein [Gemmatimonadaceae bacterium]